MFGQITKDATFAVLGTPYSLYDWEIGFFAPMLLAERFGAIQQFDLALRAVELVFNPKAKTEFGSSWRFKPFADTSDAIKEPQDGSSSTGVLGQLKRELQDENLKPQVDAEFFSPHAIARQKITSYMIWAVIRYVEILVDYGDFYFRADTLEMLPEALQLVSFVASILFSYTNKKQYVLASHIFGPKQEEAENTSKQPPRTYKTLYTTYTAVGLKTVEQFESLYPYDPSLTDEGIDLRWAFGRTMTSQYFCIPYNEKLQALRAKIDDRLYKIRHSQDINGNTRILALFEPPIDPASLIQAKLSGNINLSTTLGAGSGATINVRFTRLVTKAVTMAQELRKFGKTYLQILQSSDTSEVATFLSSQDASMQQLDREMKALAVQVAKKTVESMIQQREDLEARLKHFLDLVGQGDQEVPKLGEVFKALDNSPPKLHYDNPPTTSDQLTWNALKATGMTLEFAKSLFRLGNSAAAMVPAITLNVAFVSI